jgi:hypothetical protein
MAIVLNRAELTVRFTANQSGGGDFGGPSFQPKIERVLQFIGGTAANQFDRLFTDHRIVALSADDPIDLTGSLSGAFGQSITQTELVGLLVLADAANPGNLILGGAAANTWQGPFGGAAQTIALVPGGIFCIWGPGAAGIGDVTPGTNDQFNVHNASAAGQAGYDIVIAGRSA